MKLEDIDYSCYCSSCGERITEDGDAGGRCTSCGSMLGTFGHEGLKLFVVGTSVGAWNTKRSMPNLRNALAMEGGLTKCWAECESQVRNAIEDLGAEVTTIESVAECGKHYHLDVQGGIDVYCTPGEGGVIESTLKDCPEAEYSDMGDDGESIMSEWEAAMDAIESIILAHACAGVAVDSEQYVDGVNTALEACANNI